MLNTIILQNISLLIKSASFQQAYQWLITIDADDHDLDIKTYHQYYQTIIFNINMIKNRLIDWENNATIIDILHNPLDQEIHPIVFHYLSNKHRHDLQPFIATLKLYLINQLFFNYHKFAIVKLLKNHGQHGWINVYLHHQLVKINIAEFVDVDQSALYLLLKPLIKQQCYQTNPAIYYMALETFKYYYHHHYPFITTAISADVWAIALIKHTLHILNEPTLLDIDDQIIINHQAVMLALKKLNF